jgi:hypothetical protein
MVVQLQQNLLPAQVQAAAVPQQQRAEVTKGTPLKRTTPYLELLTNSLE